MQKDLEKAVSICGQTGSNDQALQNIFGSIKSSRSAAEQKQALSENDNYYNYYDNYYNHYYYNYQYFNTDSFDQPKTKVERPAQKAKTNTTTDEQAKVYLGTRIL